MFKLNLKEASNYIWSLARQKAPELLTAIGITAGATTTVLAVRATPEALRCIEKKKKETGHKKLTAKQTVEAAWKCYIPAAATGALSVTCLIGACTVNGRRNAALATAASIAETSLREYRSKVVETLGEKKEEAILTAVDKDRIEKNPPPENSEALPPAQNGLQVLCYDSMFGRYFWSDVETLKQAANRLNFEMNNMSEPYISLNEFYSEIGLDPVAVGDELGWRCDKGLIELHFTSQLVNGHTPCLVMSHLNPPEYGYSRL